MFDPTVQVFFIQNNICLQRAFVNSMLYSMLFFLKQNHLLVNCPLFTEQFTLPEDIYYIMPYIKMIKCK